MNNGYLLIIDGLHSSTIMNRTLLILVGIILFISSSKVKAIQAQTMPRVASGYTPARPTYQQYQHPTATYRPQDYVSQKLGQIL